MAAFFNAFLITLLFLNSDISESGNIVCSNCHDQIDCDPTGDCSITCQGPSACKDAVVNCNNAGYACDISCHQGWSCSNMRINGKNAASLTITTTTVETEQLNNATIICPNQGTCSIDCEFNYKMCESIKVNAESSTSLNITCRGISTICQNMDIYCPLNGNTDDCTIYGIPQIQSGNILNVDIYSRRGFDGVSIIGGQTDSTHNIGNIHCQDGYTSSCIINAKFNDICKLEEVDKLCEKGNAPSPTTTANPTTAIPTTDKPTSANPTTANPTTGNPTSANPTTANPTTDKPTSTNPTTAIPTDTPSTTTAPITLSPTSSCTQQQKDNCCYPGGTPNDYMRDICETNGCQYALGNQGNAYCSILSPAYFTCILRCDTTTAMPTTNKPSTSNPTTTAQPTTSKPTSAFPTTSKPTTSTPTTSKPTTSEPTTSKPTTSEPTTLRPTTAAPITSKPSTATPTTATTTSKQDTNDFTITIKGGDTDNLSKDEIETIIIKTLNITSDDIISTKINDGSITVLISIPNKIPLDEDIIKQNVEDGLVQEYGDDISVTVDKPKENASNTEEHPLSFILDNTAILIAIIIGIILVILCCILFIWFCHKKKQKNKIFPDNVGLATSIPTSSRSTNAKGEGADFGAESPSMEMQPVGIDKMRLKSITTDTDAGFSDTGGYTDGDTMGQTPLAAIADTSALPQLLQEDGDSDINDNVDEMYDVHHGKTPGMDMENGENGSDTDHDDGHLYGKGNVKTPKEPKQYFNNGEEDHHASSDSDNNGNLYGKGDAITPNIIHNNDEDTDDDNDMYHTPTTPGNH